MSFTRPMPSKFSARMRPPSNLSALTAPALGARAEASSASSKARILNGAVTLMPRPPAAAKARTVAANSASLHSILPNSSCWPVASANSVWMRGERACAMGLPMTA